MVQTLLVLLLILTQSLVSQAQISGLNSSCEIEMIQVGKGASTQLHQEAEWVLEQKGYTLVRKDEAAFDLPIVVPYQMQAQYSAGNESPSGTSDCITEDYGDYGKRSTCQYELKIIVLDASGMERSVFHLRQSIRQSLDAAGFYDRVRSELAQMPQCALL